MASARTAAAHVGKLLESVADPVCLIDDDRKVVFCNAACAQWLGVPAESLLAVQCNYHSLPDVSPADRAAATLCPPQEVFEGRRVGSSVVNPEGDKRTIEFLPLVGTSGEVVLVFVTIAQRQATETDTDTSEAALHTTLREFRLRQQRRYSLDQLLGTSPRMTLARGRVRLAMDSSASVLIEGQAGTGRDRVARTIHERGGKPFGPLVTLACGALSPEQLESSLENALHKHPAPTPTGAPTGTLLLADIDLLPREAIQAFRKRLAAPRTSLRILSTCTQSLAGLQEDGIFPAQLVCALSEIEILLPPLAGRREDLPLLAQAFLEEVNAEGGKQVSGFVPEALDLLVAHSWQNNLDQLAKAVREAHERASDAKVTPRDLPKSIILTAEANARPKKKEEAIDLVAFLERIERELIERALARAKGNKSQAAHMLGMTRPKFYRRLEQLNLHGS